MITIIVGTRPQIIKTSLIIKELSNRQIPYKLIHTGQHYDEGLSDNIFKTLEIPEPDFNLHIGSKTASTQLSEIINGLGWILNNDVVLIPGDTNSALGGAIAAIKNNCHIIHLEAGCRSYDMSMPEEVNRRMIDHVSHSLLAPTRNCVKQLADEKVQGECYWFGDPMYDLFLKEFPYVIEEENYIVATIHRDFNTDNRKRLESIMSELGRLEYKIIIPAHPRLIKNLEKYNIKLNDNVTIEPPMDYSSFIALLKHAECIVTDSGGVQKEAFWSKTPCITVRPNTEWKETLTFEWNILTKPHNITERVNYTVNLLHPRLNIADEFGYGNTSTKIVDWMISEFNIKYDKVK